MSSPEGTLSRPRVWERSGVDCTVLRSPPAGHDLRPARRQPRLRCMTVTPTGSLPATFLQSGRRPGCASNSCIHVLGVVRVLCRWDYPGSVEHLTRRARESGLPKWWSRWSVEEMKVVNRYVAAVQRGEYPGRLTPVPTATGNSGNCDGQDRASGGPHCRGASRRSHSASFGNCGTGRVKWGQPVFRAAPRRTKGRRLTAYGSRPGNDEGRLKCGMVT